MQDRKIVIAQNRLIKMTNSKTVEMRIHEHIADYLELKESRLESSLDELVQNSPETAYEAIVKAVSSILAQNTHDLLTLLDRSSSKK
jgi:hypothetical protein